MIVHLKDLAPYSSQATMWQKLVVLFFSYPGKSWEMSDLVDHVYMGDVDGGLDFPENVICKTICINRHDLPKGWALVTMCRQYRLVRQEDELCRTASSVRSAGPFARLTPTRQTKRSADRVTHGKP